MKIHYSILMLSSIFGFLAKQGLEVAISQLIHAQPAEFDLTCLNLLHKCRQNAEQFPVEAVRGAAWIIRLEHRYCTGLTDIAAELIVDNYRKALVDDACDASISLEAISSYKDKTYYYRSMNSKIMTEIPRDYDHLTPSIV